MFLKATLPLTLGLTLAMGEFAQAQPRPACQPPAQNEYLLLVLSQTPASQAQLQRTLPPNVTTSICAYQGDTVTRIGGFSSLEVATSWARYLTEISGLSAFVVRPAETAAARPNPPGQNPPVISLPQPASPVKPPVSPSPASPAIAYAPKPLGVGYAVLVDYLNKPELAAQIRQLTGRDVGLASYGQRPYLLANYTPDQKSANATLKALSDRGYKALVVDSRKVVLLRQSVGR